MKSRLRKKVAKANEFYDHNDNYTPRQVMASYYWWKRYIRKRKLK